MMMREQDSRKFFSTLLRKRVSGVGANQVMMAGGILVTLMFSAFAIDLPLYFSTQNQLQTAVDAAALAGAASLPFGEAEAESAAYEYASQNPVAGNLLNFNDLDFNYTNSTFEVSASTQVPTIMARMLCGFQHAQEPAEEGDVGGNPCESMTISAHAKAIPAARDTILVIDTSSSMNDLGNNQPFKDVKEAAVSFLDMVRDLDSESVDRIGVVTFDKSSALRIKLTSQQDSPDFQAVESKINGLQLYSGSGWNTNYYAGMKTALDELQLRGRKNATKTIIFLTDGFPNLPGGGTDINTCVSYYNKTSNKTYWRQQAKICAENYTNYLVDVTKAQADRSLDMEVTVHTIQIGGDDSASVSTLRTLLQDNTWDPELLDYMANTTEGEQYAAANNNGDGIAEIYNTIAKNIRMKLAG